MAPQFSNSGTSGPSALPYLGEFWQASVQHDVLLLALRTREYYSCRIFKPCLNREKSDKLNKKLLEVRH